MNCQEVMELMHRQLDGDLSGDELDVLMNHTRQCPECAATFERLKRLSAELASLPKVMPKYSLVDAILPELERIELQSKQAAAIQTPAALSPDEQSRASRRLQRKRRWPSWSAAFSVVAAGIVAGVFILNAPSNFGGASNDQAAESSADMFNRSIADSSDATALSTPLAKEGAAGGDIPMDEIEIKSFPTDPTKADVLDTGTRSVEGGGNSSESNKDVESMEVEPAADEEIASVPEPTGEPDAGVQGIVGTPVSGETEDGAASGGEEEVQDQFDKMQDPPNGIAAFEEFPSPDGRYIARAEEFSVMIVSADSGETLMETPRKNGQHGQLVWSEDSAELFYDVQLDQGAIEKYVIQTSDWTEAKAPH